MGLQFSTTFVGKPGQMPNSWVLSDTCVETIRFLHPKNGSVCFRSLSRFYIDWNPSRSHQTLRGSPHYFSYPGGKIAEINKFLHDTKITKTNTFDGERKKPLWGRKYMQTVRIAFRLRSNYVQLRSDCVRLMQRLRKYYAKNDVFFKFFLGVTRSC